MTVVVTLAPTIVAAIIAVAVPWMTFQLALRQDHTRWLREQRAQLYVDLLVEAYAEQKYLDFVLADEETRKRIRKYSPDLRFPPLERARLGARSNAFASETVNRLFNRMLGEMSSATLKPQPNEAERMVTRVRIMGVWDELQDAIRHEVGADKIMPAAKTTQGR